MAMSYVCTYVLLRSYSISYFYYVIYVGDRVYS